MPVEDVAAQKAALRREMRAVRAVISANAEERARRSQQIWDGIVELVLVRLRQRRPAPTIMLFESLLTEPDTRWWYTDARDRGWRTFGPEVDGPDLHVSPGRLDPLLLDVVVFPGLAFTSDGARLGQGGGHYDRFAARLDGRCLRIGACYAAQVVDDVPMQAHDQRVDIVVSG